MDFYLIVASLFVWFWTFLKFISSFKSFDNILNNFKFSSKKLMFFYILTSVVNSPDILNLEEKFQIVLAKSCGW